MLNSLCYWEYNEANYENEDSKDKETLWIRTEFALLLVHLEGLSVYEFDLFKFNVLTNGM